MSIKRLATKPSTSTRYALDDNERYALCCYCVFECTKMDAFKLAHPELVGTRNVLKARCDEFFASSDVINFMREYKDYLDSVGNEGVEKPKVSQEDREKRKREALEILADDLLSQIFALRAGASDLDRETIIKMVDKIGWLGDDEIKQEQPRRYLPETCRSSCRYRAFVEQECEDLCEYCKYKKYGEENGVHYESEKQLEMPQSSGENE